MYHESERDSLGEIYLNRPPAGLCNLTRHHQVRAEQLPVAVIHQTKHPDFCKQKPGCGRMRVSAKRRGLTPWAYRQRHAFIGTQSHTINPLHDPLLGGHLVSLKADDLAQT